MKHIVKTRSHSIKEDIKASSPRSVTDVDSDIGLRVQTYRTIEGFTRAELAKGIGVTNQQLQKYEKGTNRISVSALIRIANFLNRNINEFFLTDKIAFKFNDSAKDSYDNIKSNMDSEIQDEIRTLIGYYSKVKDKSKRDFIISIIKNFSSNLV